MKLFFLFNLEGYDVLGCEEFCVMGVLSAIFGVWARMRMERLWVRCSPLRYFMRGRASLAFSVSVLRLVSMSSGMSILSRSTWRR